MSPSDSEPSRLPYFPERVQGLRALAAVTTNLLKFDPDCLRHLNSAHNYLVKSAAAVPNSLTSHYYASRYAFYEDVLEAKCASLRDRVKY